jgi:hypothetical protein
MKDETNARGWIYVAQGMHPATGAHVIRWKMRAHGLRLFQNAVLSADLRGEQHSEWGRSRSVAS